MRRGLAVGLIAATLAPSCRAHVREPAAAPPSAGQPVAIGAPSARAMTAPSVPAAAARVTYRADLDPEVRRWIGAEWPGIRRRYEELHAHPELSLAEHATAALVASELASRGYQVTAGVGGTGVVAVLANGDGPVVLVRGDMDALPVREETGLAYASTVTATLSDGNATGVMHACGHDVHTATLLATSALLAELRPRWRGTVVVVAQPAEELGRGADLMIRDGLFMRFPKPDACVALHVAADLPAGRIGVTPGFHTANVDSVDVTIHGRGGHGARPHETVDPS